MEKTARQYRIADGQLPESPVTIEGFDADSDVLIMAVPGMSRSDLALTQNGDDIEITLASDSRPLVTVKDTRVADLDPVPMLKAFYAALATSDPGQVTAFLTEDTLWEVAGPTDIMPWAGSWHGHAGVTSFLVLLNAGLAYETLEPTRYIAQGNTVAVVLDGRGESKAGISYQGGVVHWITVRNGKISRLQYYRDTFPVIEAIRGGRPFTVQPMQGDSHYHVISPLAGLRTTDSIVFDPDVLENPPKTVKTVKAMYAALQGLNVPEVRKVFATNVVWDIFGPPDLLSWAGERIGPDAAAESASQILATMHFDHFKPTRMIYQDNVAAIVIDEAGTSLVTGLPFRTSVVHIVEANDEGQVTLFKNYINTAWIVEAFLNGRPYTVNPV